VHTYAALLRGINVGKAKRLAMADLRTLVEALGYTDVRTLLNSGNVVFDTAEKDAARIASRIEQGIVEAAGFRSNVIVVSRRDVAAIVGDNALAAQVDNPSRLLVAFVRDATVLTGLAPLTSRDWAPEALHVGTKAAYLWCPGGVLGGQVVEASGRVLGDKATTRNWATVLKLHDLMARR
jgi:uncharacterized protein (DUF1697 family)